MSHDTFVNLQNKLQDSESKKHKYFPGDEQTDIGGAKCSITNHHDIV